MRTGRFIFSRDAARQLDRLAVEQYLIPSIVLMENAAIHLASTARRMMPRRDGRVLILCGPGNNGGDGLALARHLHNGGARVEIVLSTDPDAYLGDSAVNLAVVRAMGLKLHRRPPRGVRPGLVVDALLGTGLTRPVREPLAGLIRTINRSRVPVMAVDIPSGLDADTGEVLGIVVRADVTVTMAGWKAGFLRARARDYVGRVKVADIGVPRELLERLAARG